MHKISSGAKKDLMVLQFVQALLEVSKQDETVKDENITSRASNANYHVNKRITNALNKISDRIKGTIETIYKEGGNDLAKWIRANLDKRIGGTLVSIQHKTINLEMLALWIAFVNFCERDKVVHPAFVEWTNEKQYFNIIELMSGTEIARLEGDMFDISYDVIARIKR